MGIGVTGYPALVSLLQLNLAGYAIAGTSWFGVTGPGWPYGQDVFPDSPV